MYIYFMFLSFNGILIFLFMKTALCPLGKEYMYSSGKCELCRVGFYKNISGSHIECFQCPVNFTTRQEGAVGFQDCKLGKINSETCSI